MTGKPVATIGSMQVCPMCSGTMPHVGGMITGLGASGVTINGKPVAVMGDICTCAAGSPSTIIQGESGVLINGVPVATVGCMTSHGGVITQGEPNVIITATAPNARTRKTIKKIPFPQIRTRDKLGSAISGNYSTFQQTEKNLTKLKEDLNEQGKTVLNVYWMDEQSERIIDVLQYGGKATLFAKTQNMEGESLSITIGDKDENDLESEVKEITYSGTVGSDGIAQLAEVEIKKDWEQTEKTERKQPKLTQ